MRAQPEGVQLGRATFRARGRRRDPVFRAALIFSALFHLSMVTVFNVVIFFPRQDLQYFDFRIVEETPYLSEPKTAPDKLRIRSMDDLLAGELGLTHEALLARELPEIELPTLEFAELSRLEVRQRSFASPSIYDNLFADEPRDSWERFGAGIQRVRESLSRLSLSRGPAEDTLLFEKPVRRRPVHRPAEGFEAYIEWNTEPKDRKLLFAAPIKALWEVPPDSLEHPIEIVIAVNAHGRVINVWSLLGEEGSLLDSIQAAVLKYRFEPLPIDESGVTRGDAALSPTRQRIAAGARAASRMGTLRIRAAGGGP